MITEGAKSFAEAMVWSKDQTHTINTHLTHLSIADKHLYIWKPEDLDPVQFTDDLAKMAESDLFFSVSLLRAKIFFRSRFIGFSKSNMQFRYPDKVFKVQRRNDVRLPVRDGYVLRVEYQDPLNSDDVLSRKAFDISAGGISILVPQDESAMYPRGLILKNLTLTIRQKVIHTDATVCHVSEIKGNPNTENVKVGLQFKDLQPADNQHIASYVFEESRRYYSRLM